ncbi:cell envelope integrity protein TolA [Aureimonas fodinaquatilis]|uniref:Cell envelope integrity protein TolA n=1 Tax=Aureimonas fodinaquatilis TaxID=2565783 RepID=A0A5B0DXR0_9HYPH|nr:cell envelope integrity protein TolA [Aureimonas fodinaquatilis]KAA0971138.1 cell envelope integrity protein TolA [Aureimonas fodinaquatilis]
MKSLATSTALHAVILTMGLWAFGEPRPLDLTQGESLPVTLVTMEEYSQAMIGAEDAPVAETSTPDPTQTPEQTPMPAENVGDNEVDLESPPRPVPAPRDTVQTATAEAPPPPAPQTPPTPEPEPQVEPEQPVEPQPPEPEAVAEPQPAEPAETAPEPEVIDEAALPAETPPEPQMPQMPQNVPVPQAKPTPPPAQRAAPRPVETRTTETANDDAEKEFDADEIAALLNRDASAGGGARRSTETANLGTTRQTGSKLSQSELDALRAQVSRCWSPPVGLADAGPLLITVTMQLDPTGQLMGMPQIVRGGGSSMVERAAGDAAVRAVRRCAPYSLPADKYDNWANVTMNFDPSQMF